jgi:hypothetical protein
VLGTISALVPDFNNVLRIAVSGALNWDELFLLWFHIPQEAQLAADVEEHQRISAQLYCILTPIQVSVSLLFATLEPQGLFSVQNTRDTYIDLHI